MYKINLKKLVPLLQYNFNNLTIWTEEPISISDIKKSHGKMDSLNIPFGNIHETFNHEWDRIDHIRRILYFAENSHEIKGISIDNQVLNGSILPIPVIVDGNHRLMAAIYLGMSYVECGYGGREDLLYYLTDETDILPVE